MTTQCRMVTASLVAALLLPLACSAARADEGMWTFDNFPSKTVANVYRFAASQAWLDRVRLADSSTVRRERRRMRCRRDRLDARSALDLSTPMNPCTSNDVIGGNSGSLPIDKTGAVVGLIFDGNIFSPGGDYGYDPARNRSVAVDSRALLEGFRKVYHLDRITSEIEAAR